MTQQEFESRTGEKVTAAAYATVEEIYLNAGSIDKDVFCREWKKHGSSLLLGIYFHQYLDNKKKVEKANKEWSDMVDWLITMAHLDLEEDKRSQALHKKAVSMSSHGYVALRTLELDFNLFEEDIIWIKDHLHEVVSESKATPTILR